MYCPNCGKENKDDNAFCFACGFDLSKDDLQSAPIPKASDVPISKKRDFPQKALICALVIIALCIAGGALYKSGLVNSDTQKDTSNPQLTQEQQPSLNRDGVTVYTTYSLWGEIDYIAREGEYEILSYEGTDKILDFSQLFEAVDLTLSDFSVIIDKKVFADRPIEKVSANCCVTVGVKAFEDCDLLKAVSFTGKTKIKDGAFNDCWALASVSMENVSEIGSSAFENCRSLTQVNMTNVSEIGLSAFKNCENLTQINMTNVSEIGSYAFENCRSLTQVNMPNVKTININSFKDCTKLETVSITSVESIGDMAFENCTNLSVLELPEKNIEISYTAFSGSKQEKIFTQKFKNEEFTAYTPNGEIQFSTDGKTVFLEKYTGNDKSIDSSMISKALGITSYERIEIGDSCFEGTDVEKANLTGFAKVGTRAFAGCKKLNELSCNAYLDDYAFEGCVNLRSVDISPLPTDVKTYDFTTSIGKGCFKDSGIENINNLYFSEVDYHIKQNAFEGTPIEAAANEKIYNRTAMMIYPEKYRDCDFDFRASLENSIYDYNDVLYAKIISGEAESDDNIIALEKSSEFVNISANAMGELDIVCTFTGENAFKFEYQGLYGDSVIPLFTIKEIKNSETIGGNNDSSYLKLSDLSMEELLSPGFEDKYYGVGFTFDIHVFTAEGGMAGSFTGLDMMSGYNVRTMAFYPGGSDVGKVYRMYGTFFGFYTDEEGYTYLNFELDDYDYKDVTDEYF